MAYTVAILRILLVDKVLTVTFRIDVAIAMVPAHTTIYCQFILFLVVQVHACHLHGVQALASSAPTAASTTTGEAHIVGIVGVTHHEHLQIVFHHTTEDTACITALGTGSQVDIGHHALVHTLLDTEIEHRLFLTVLDTRHASQIALLVVGLNAVDNIGRQILQGSLGIASHKLFTVDEDFLYLLTVNLNCTIVAHLCTRYSSYQFLYNRTFWCTESGSIIDEGIGFHRYFRGMGCYGSTFQHDSIWLQGDGTCLIVLAIFQRNFLGVSFETHVGNLQRISTLFRGYDMKVT